MRKTLVAILSFLLTVGFGASAYAGHAADEGYEYTPKLVKAGKSNIDLSGSIRVRGEFRDNTSDFNSEEADYMADYDSRIRLKVDATVSPNTKGVIEIENGYFTEGEDTYTWGDYDYTSGAGSYGGIGNNGDGNYKPDVFMIRQAYIATQGTKLLGVLSGVKAGHILTKLGNGVFLNHAKYGDDAIVLWTAPQKGTEVSLTMSKWGENSSTAGNDDATAYTLAVGTGAAGINLGADVTYIDDQDYTSGLYSDPSDTSGLHFWNLGLRGDTNVAGVKLYGDVEIQSGKAKDGYNTGSSTQGDMKFKGYAWVLGANVDVPNSPVSVGAEVGYGSGDKVEDTTDTTGDYTGTDSGNKYEGFLTTIGDSGNLGVRKTAYLYDDKINDAACNGSDSAISCGKAGISNAWYINVGADAKVTPDLTAGLDIFYIRASKGVAINDATNANGSPKRSKAIGTEVDATVTYQIDTNLVYFVEAGYMFAGSAYDYRTPMTADGNNTSADNPYGVRHGLTLEF